MVNKSRYDHVLARWVSCMEMLMEIQQHPETKYPKTKFNPL